MKHIASNWVTFTRRTEQPKLQWLMDALTDAGIPNKIEGSSAHAPILMVPEEQLDAAWAVLDPVDDLPDDDQMFWGDFDYGDPDLDPALYEPPRRATTRPQGHRRSALRTLHRGDTMTRKPSKNRRRRFAERIEEARSNRGRKNRLASKDATDISRLERRVASLNKMLRAAQQELRETAPRRPERRTARPRMTLAERKREARVREIRAKIDAERERQARIEERHQRMAAYRDSKRRPARRRAAAPPKRQARTQQREAAPKMFRRKKDGKVYVRVD